MSEGSFGALRVPFAAMNITDFRLSWALLLIVFSVGAVAAPQDDGFTVNPAVPAAESFKVGAVDVTVLHDAQILVPNDGRTFGTTATTDEVSEILRSAGAPTGEIALSVNVLLVKSAGHLILLDAGTGPEWHGTLPESLKAVGVTAAAITDVLITHAHGDHINGLLDAQGHLAFPNARILMSDEEWEWTKTKGSEVLVTAISDHVDSFRPGGIVAPGIRSIAIEGHTPGHVGYEIFSEGAQLRDVGDLVHSSILSLARPQWLNAFDRDAEGARAVRLSMLAKLAASHERVFAPHFPYPGVGFIVPEGAAFRWQPALP